MTFIHPFLLWFIGLTAIPFIIQRIGQRHHDTQFFAPFYLLEAMQESSSWFQKIQHLLLLLLRMLFIASIVLAIATPTPPQTTAVGAQNNQPQHTVYVLDVSASMLFKHNNTTLLDLAKHQIIDHIQQDAPTNSTEIITNQNPPQIFTHTDSLISSIRNITFSNHTSTLHEATTQAKESCNRSNKQCTIMILSDFHQNAWGHTSRTPDVQIQWIQLPNTKKSNQQHNLSISAAKAQLQQNHQYLFTVDLESSGKIFTSKRALELIHNNTIVQKIYIDPFYGKTRKQFLYTIQETKSELYTLQLENSNEDGYNLDDILLFELHPIKPIEILGITNQTNTLEKNNRFFFLQKAIEQNILFQNPMHLTLATNDDLSSPSFNLEHFDIVVWASDASVSPQAIKHLEQFYHHGGNFLFTLSNDISFESMNEHFSILLPSKLRDMQNTTLQANSLPLHLKSTSIKHPILQHLGNDGIEQLTESKTHSYFHVEPQKSFQTILQFNNQAPALLEKINASSHDGKSLLLTTSVDDSLSNLALQPVFPALMQSVFLYLTQQLEHPIVEYTRSDTYCLDLRCNSNLEESDFTQAELPARQQHVQEKTKEWVTSTINGKNTNNWSHWLLGLGWIIVIAEAAIAGKMTR